MKSGVGIIVADENDRDHTRQHQICIEPALALLHQMTHRTHRIQSTHRVQRRASTSRESTTGDGTAVLGALV